jgi:hypothetical protein
VRKGKGTYKVDKIVLGAMESAVNEGTGNAMTFGSSTKRVITKNDLQSGDKDCTWNDESDGVGQEGGGDQSSSTAKRRRGEPRSLGIGQASHAH